MIQIKKYLLQNGDEMKETVTIEIDFDQISAIVLHTLKEDYRMVNKNDNDEELLSALNMVISYYSSREQFEEWVKEKRSLHLDELAKTDGELL